MMNKCYDFPTSRVFTAIFSGLCLWSFTIAVSGNTTTVIVSAPKNFINVDASLQPIASNLIIEQGKTIKAITSPLFITSQSLASLFDTDVANSQKDIIKHIVAKGETLSSIAGKYNITVQTILLANELDSSAIHEGQELLILPVNGMIHMVDKGETLSSIAKDYSANKQEIIDYNGLAENGDIYIGDVLIVPNGKAPKPVITTPTTSKSYAQVTLPNSYFIVPTIGIITQGPHYSETSNGIAYYNSVDIANAIGTPVVAAAGGTIQIVKNRWPYGNYITILHPNGVVTLYSHLNSFARNIVPGATVSQGQVIGFMGNTGRVVTKGGNGSHLHFETRGAKNPLSRFIVGSKISY